MDQNYEKKSTSIPVSAMKTIIFNSVVEDVLLTPRAPQLQSWRAYAKNLQKWLFFSQDETDDEKTTPDNIDAGGGRGACS